VKKHRVLVVIQNISYTHDTRMRQIVESLVRDGFEVDVLCPRMAGDPRQARRGGAEVRFFRMPAGGDGTVSILGEYAYSMAVLAVLVPWLTVRRRIGVVHVCVPPHVVFPLLRLLRVLKRTVVVDQHDLMPELFELRYGHRAGWLRRLVRVSERHALAAADSVIVTNQTAARRALERCSVDPSRLVVVRSSSAVETPNPPPPRPDGGILVGFVGNVAPQDGVEQLVRAAAYVRLTKGRRDVRFVVVGDGSALPGARRLAAELRVADAVRFTGRLPHEAALRHMAECDVCVQPDERNAFNETCTMLKALEYMALGKPVVAGDLAETRVSCGDAALYAADGSAEEVGDLILRLADDEQLRTRLGAEGRRRVEGELSWAHGEAALLDLYRRIAGRGS
jgi:glycosyltransferase involved in cell wall biosynthesis